MESKIKINAINDAKENAYEKDCMKIKFNSDDDLPFNKPLKFHAMTIVIRFPSTIELIFQKELLLIKQVHESNVIFVAFGILKILVLSTNHIFAMVVMI